MLYIKQANGRYRPATDDELFAEAAEARLKLFSAIRKPLTCPSDVGPFGVAEPSEADRSITMKLAKALLLVEIRLLDHVVVGAEHVTSMAERGLI